MYLYIYIYICIYIYIYIYIHNSSNQALGAGRDHLDPAAIEALQQDPPEGTHPVLRRSPRLTIIVCVYTHMYISLSIYIYIYTYIHTYMIVRELFQYIS